MLVGKIHALGKLFHILDFYQIYPHFEVSMRKWLSSSGTEIWAELFMIVSPT